MVPGPLSSLAATEPAKLVAMVRKIVITITASTAITMDDFSEKMLQPIVEKLHSILALIAISSVAN